MTFFAGAQARPDVTELARRLCGVAAGLPLTPEQHRFEKPSLPCAIHLDQARNLIGLITDRTTMRVLTVYADEIVR